MGEKERIAREGEDSALDAVPAVDAAPELPAPDPASVPLVDAPEAGTAPEPSEPEPDADASPGSEPEPESDPDAALTPRERREIRLRRIRQRRRRKWLIVLVLAVSAVLMYVAWPVMAGRFDAVKKLDDAQALVSRAAPVVDGIDKVVAQQLSAKATPGVADVAPQVLVARRDLKAALALVTEAMPRLTDDEQKRAKAIEQSAKARLAMVDAASDIISTSVKAVKSKSIVDEAWRLTTQASAAETIAVASYRAGKASSVESASVGLQRVTGQFSDARALYSQAASAFPAAKLERYIAYVDLRTKQAKWLSQAAGSWLAGDKPGASAEYDAYRMAATKSAAAIARLPMATAAPGQAFRRIAGPAADAYAKAKKQAADADKALEGL